MILYNSLNSRERAVLDALWEAGKPLSQRGILELIPNEIFTSRASSYSAINSLLEKDLIEFAGITSGKRKFARMFKPKIHQYEFLIRQLVPNGTNEEGVLKFFEILLSKLSGNDLLHMLDFIEDLIKKRRQEL